MPAHPPCLLSEHLSSHGGGSLNAFKRPPHHILCMSSHYRDRHSFSKMNCSAGQHRGNIWFFSTAAQRPPERCSEQALLCPFLHRQTGMEGTPTPPVDRGTALPVPAALQNTQPQCPVPSLFPDPTPSRAEPLALKRAHKAGQAEAVSPSKGMLNLCPPSMGFSESGWSR